jgi:hypothetical protein
VGWSDGDEDAPVEVFVYAVEDGGDDVQGAKGGF